MLNLRTSSAQTASRAFRPLSRRVGEDNMHWLSRVAGKRLSDKGACHLVLLGGVDPTAFRLRVAQSHVRHDLSPSHWSHVVLLDGSAKGSKSTNVYEVSLTPVGGFGFPPPTNGIQEVPLETYANAKAWPNIAVIHVPMPNAEALGDKGVAGIVDRIRGERGVVDLPGLVVSWLAFVWGIGATGNPLFNGQGIPSAVLAEHVLATVGIDITPGLASQSSCPEAVWQAARWWQGYYKTARSIDVEGVWCIKHRIGPG